MSKTSREILLNIAIGEFASFGYAKASIRSICQLANINVSSISYYFGGKDKLYEAVIKESVNKINDYLNPVISKYNNAKEIFPNKDVALNILKEMIKYFVEAICVPKFPEDIIRIYLNEYANPTKFFTLFEQNINNFYIPIISDLLIQANDNNISDKEAAVYVFILFSQIFNLSVRKNAVLKLIDENNYSAQNIEMFIKIISSSVLI